MSANLEHLSGETYPETLEGQLAALERDETLRRFRESRERLASDPYRPLYHLSPPENSMNDPNGLCQWRGRYHLFYQFRPVGIDRVHWGHAVSDDLVGWRDLPPALYPDREMHCFSGQALVEPERVVAIYHGTESGNSIATASDPLLLNWEKHPDNPVIPIVPIDDDGRPYRVFDPCIWKQDDGYYYSLSGTYRDGEIGRDCRAVDYVFRSRDLGTWDRLGPLIDGTPNTEPGEDGAVPNFLPIGPDKHMLLFFSHKRAAQYYVGDYDSDSHRLTPQSHGRMNYGPFTVGSLHAPSATIDERGRFIAFFNVKEGIEPRGWNDVMTLPRHLSLAEDGSVRIRPASETDGLRTGGVSVGPVDIPANGETPIPQVAGRSMEIEAVIAPGEAREVGLTVLRSPDGAEQTRISLFRQDHRRFGVSSLQIDVSASSLSGDVFARSPEIGPIDLPDGDALTLRVFVDRSIVEVFANERQCLTVRVYPERDDSVGVSAFARGGGARLASMEAWQMRSIWPELAHLEGR